MSQPAAPTDPLDSLRHAADGAQRLAIAWLGVEAGLFDALAACAATPVAIAAARGLDPVYTQRWAEAALAYGLLEEVPSAPTWTLRPTTAGALLCEGQPGLPLAVGFGLTAHATGRLPALVRSGARPGEVLLSENPSIAPHFGAMLEAGFGRALDTVVLPQVPAYAEQLAHGGLVIDLGCGNGWFLRRLLGHFSAASGLGVDGMPDAIADGRARAEAAGLSHRLELRCADVLPLPAAAGAALIALNRALHHVWDRQEAVLSAVVGALAPTGIVAIWEPAWPEDPRSLARPGRRGLTWNNLLEHVQGNHLLHPDQIAAALTGAGLRPEITMLPGGDVVVIGRRPG